MANNRRTPDLTMQARGTTPELHAIEGELLPAGSSHNAVLAYIGHFNSESGRRVMRSTLLQVALRLGHNNIKTAPWHTLTRHLVMELIGQIAAEVLPKTKIPRYSPASVNRFLTAIKGVAKEARYLGLLSVEDYQGIKDVQGVRGSRVASGRALGRDEANQFLEACDTVNEGRSLLAIRDKALFALLFGSGMRRSEVVSLDMNTLSVREQSFTVIGKGGVERYVDMTPKAWDLLQPWLNARRMWLEEHMELLKELGNKSMPVFVRIRKGNQMTNEGMTDQAVYYLTEKIQMAAGIGAVSPHDMRRSFITWMLEDGDDIALVADMVGHADIQTTKKYDKRGRIKRQKSLRSKKDF